MKYTYAHVLALCRQMKELTNLGYKPNQFTSTEVRVMQNWGKGTSIPLPANHGLPNPQNTLQAPVMFRGGQLAERGMECHLGSCDPPPPSYAAAIGTPLWLLMLGQLIQVFVLWGLQKFSLSLLFIRTVSHGAIKMASLISFSLMPFLLFFFSLLLLFLDSQVWMSSFSDSPRKTIAGTAQVSACSC